MRRFSLVLSLLIPAIFVSGCSGNTGSPIVSTPGTSSLPGVHPAKGLSNTLRLLGVPHTPLRPPPRHKITAAMRARALAGGWTPLTHTYPGSGGADTALLMTDGTVMVHDYCTSNWYSLAPDSTGSYVNGTWTKTAALPSNYGPLYFGSAVLADGKLIINGGEYNFCNTAETTLGAIYDPFHNTWTAVSPPSGWSTIGDSSSVVLSNGTYMLANCCNSQEALLNESSMSWTSTGTGKHDANSEEGWTLLPNGDVLTADVFSAPASELYNPTTGSWSLTGNVPGNFTLSDEMGPQTLRPNNTVFLVGGNGLTASYSLKTGTWTQGPTLPKMGSQQINDTDGPATLLRDGSVLFVGSPGVYSPPSQFLILKGTSTLVSIANPPNAPNDPSFVFRLLMLPNGQVLECDDSSDVQIYTAGSQHIHKGTTPKITSVPTTLSPGSTYTVQGTRFNGDSQDSTYGDDAQAATNYPLVRITASNGQVYYARTHNHSFMGVRSSKTVSTMFDVPSTIPSGAAMLVVVANGVSSAPVSVTIN
jgi:hypothetical protein